MELEQIRMLHPVKPDFAIDADESLMIPPMLLIPLVENIFKHGVDKTVQENKVVIELKKQNNYLHFITCNSISTEISERPNGGGLKNLRKRLELLYDTNFDLTVGESNSNFKASLKFPV